MFSPQMRIKQKNTVDPDEYSDIIHKYTDKEEKSNETIVISSDSTENENEFYKKRIPTKPLYTFNFFRLLERKDKLDVHGHILEHSDLRRLIPGKWLNDKIINAYFELLSRDYPHVKFFTTYFYSTVKKYKRSGYVFDIDAEKCRVEWKNYDSLCFPIHYGSHWALYVYNFKCIIAFDSMGYIKYDDTKIFRELMEYVFPNKKPINIRTANMGDFPTQNNGNDCGVFVCMYAKSVASKTSYYDGSMVIYRRRILHELYAKRIIYINTGV